VNDDLDAVDQLVVALFRDYASHERLREYHGSMDGELWKALVESGLTRLGISEDTGGSGGGLPELAVVLHRAGEYSAQVPLAETILADAMLSSVDLPLPEGVVTVGLGDVSATRSGTGWRIEGELRRTAFARLSDSIVGVAGSAFGPLVFVVSSDDTTIAAGANLAGEPRDHVTIAVHLSDDAVSRGGAEHELVTRGRLFRSMMMSGAAHNALELTVRYAAERRQFGRPIAAFQAVQQQLAMAAAEVAASHAAVHAAVAACGTSALDASAEFAINAAKVRSSQSAGAVAAVAHQIHGAIGITHEYPLHLSTTRLWSWRDEWGTEVDCARQLTRAAVAPSGPGLWPTVVGP
jgi:acyl-CoA dehydrogenase